MKSVFNICQLIIHDSLIMKFLDFPIIIKHIFLWRNKSDRLQEHLSVLSVAVVISV